MNDMSRICDGFAVLTRYDDTRGGVSADHDMIWAGPQEVEQDEFTSGDQLRLEALGWAWDDKVGRWSFAL